MINIFLSLIIVLLIAGIILRPKQPKRAHIAEAEVENCVRVVSRSQYHISRTVAEMAERRWVLTAAHLTKNGNEILFFSRKKELIYFDEN